jgi:hypothetical protein
MWESREANHYSQNIDASFIKNQSNLSFTWLPLSLDFSITKNQMNYSFSIL